MEKKSILLLIIYVCLLESCHKEQEEVLNYNFGNYNLVDVETSDIRLFTKDGEIFDKQIINDHVTSKGHDFLIEKKQTILESIQIKFLSDTTIDLISADKSEIRNVIYKKNVLFFEQTELSLGIIDDIDRLSEFTTYSPLYYKVDNVQIGSIDQSTVEYKDCIYGTYSKNKITIPRLYISLSTKKKKSFVDNPDLSIFEPSYPYETSNFFIGGLFNDFNESKISLLINNEYYTDTLTVQTRDYVFDR